MKKLFLTIISAFAIISMTPTLQGAGGHGGGGGGGGHAGGGFGGGHVGGGASVSHAAISGGGAGVGHAAVSGTHAGTALSGSHADAYHAGYRRGYGHGHGHGGRWGGWWGWGGYPYYYGDYCDCPYGDPYCPCNSYWWW